MIDKNGILFSLKNKKYCVLATASTTCKPESAVLSYVVKDDFTLLMSTDSASRKAVNIAINNQASVLIGGLDGSSEIQIDGQIVFLEGPVSQNAQNYIFSIYPDFKDRMTASDKIIEFKPLWLRYSDFSLDPPEIVEMTDF